MDGLNQILPEPQQPAPNRPALTPMNIHAANANCHCRDERPAPAPQPAPAPVPCACKRPCCFRLYLDAGHEPTQGFVESAIVIDTTTNRKYFYDGDGTPLEMVSIEAFNSLVARVEALEQENESEGEE